MSVKLIVSDKNITIDNFKTEVFIAKNGRKWNLTNEKGSDIDLKIQVRNCCVKYTPEKYDKITVELDTSSKGFFEDLQEFIKTEVDIQNIVKGNTVGLKMTKDQKLLCLRTLQQGDYFDAVINFNDIWTVNGKNYVSLELIQFKKLDITPKVEVINYFIDDN